MIFTQTQSVLLFSALLFLILASYFQLSRRKELWVIITLCFAALSIFSFAALLDPYLNLWDERFHALVAKNMMDQPFKPLLYENPVKSLLIDRWDGTDVWLHKQPLFLWQIALSFKIFGLTEFSLRIPSILLAVLFMLAVYKTAKIIVNQRVAFFSSVLIISSFYLTSLVSGKQLIEHNDISFLAYVSLSIWSLVEYERSKKIKWLIFIGLFSGMAILCKWLVGLIVYAGWAAMRVYDRELSFKKNIDLLIALLVTTVVALPWQIYTFIRFPEVAAREMEYNSLHFTEVIEGHGGDAMYHLDQVDVLYGANSLILLFISFIFAYWKISKRKYFYLLISMLLAVYLFYTMAATKMPSFTLVIALVVFIFLANLIDALLLIFNKKSFQSLAFITVLVVLVINRFEYESYVENHFNKHKEIMVNIKNTFKSLDLPQNTVVFNVPGRHYIECMFYTDYTAYNDFPSKEVLMEVDSMQRPLAIFVKEQDTLPNYLKREDIILIHKSIEGYK